MRRAAFTAFLVPLALGLSACGRQEPLTKQLLLGHTWAHNASECGTRFLKFSETAMEVYDRGHVSALAVKNLVQVPDHPEDLLLVVDPGDTGGSTADADMIAYLLENNGGRLKLVAQGSPIELIPATADDANAKRFDRMACPTT